MRTFLLGVCCLLILLLNSIAFQQTGCRPQSPAGGWLLSDSNGIATDLEQPQFGALVCCRA